MSRFMYYSPDSNSSGRSEEENQNRNSNSKDKTDKSSEIQKSADTGTDAWGHEADNMKPKDGTYGDDTYSGVSS